MLSNLCYVGCIGGKGWYVSGINQNVVFSVCRVFAHFRDDLGNPLDVHGTGFWIKKKNGELVFVTNKHNVDPTLKLGADTKYSLEGLDINLRSIDSGGRVGSETKFFPVNEINKCLYKSASADVAILDAPKVGDATYKPFAFIGYSDLANQDFFQNKTALMDMASFIGYPGSSSSHWWDEKLDLAIARLVNIASYPSIQFSNHAIATSDVTLVSGLSFSGSSGSVVFLHEKGVKVGNGLVNTGYVEPKVLGIMSGHFWEPDATPKMFMHSGLSYFTRSTSILELMNECSVGR